VRILRRRPDAKRPGRATVAVAFIEGELVPMAGEMFDGERVEVVRRSESPEPGIRRDERVYVLEVVGP
jgi:hypothetical protein